eukprot:scaffold1525_cov142-Cylindrotheca_fusiformis.AAC.47
MNAILSKALVVGPADHSAVGVGVGVGVAAVVAVFVGKQRSPFRRVVDVAISERAKNLLDLAVWAMPVAHDRYQWYRLESSLLPS